MTHIEVHRENGHIVVEKIINNLYFRLWSSLGVSSDTFSIM